MISTSSAADAADGNSEINASSASMEKTIFFARPVATQEWSLPSLPVQERSRSGDRSHRANALSHINKPALKVVEPMIVKALDDNPNWNTINPPTLARAVNRVKSKRTAKNPTDLFFQIKMDLMPTSFFRGEVVVGSKRHLIFMTDEQLSLLKTAVRWYADGTFKIINFPFTQLFSLHGFKIMGS